MSNATRMFIVAAFAAALTACGGGARLAPGKQNAAAAAFMASQGASGAGGSIFNLARQNAGVSLDFSRSCAKAGKVDVHYLLDTSVSSGTLKFSLVYSGCSFNGKTTLNGTMTVELSATASSSAASASLAMNGRVDFSGDIQDFVSATNLTETLDVSLLSSGDGASVGLLLNGTLQTSSDTYTFNNESFSITTGHLDPDPSHKG